MYYSKIIPMDIANGPGWRVTLFTSGCRRGCKGCFNKEAWDFKYGQEFTYKTLSEIDILLQNPVVRGISILGGDPFEPENREAVAEICAFVKLWHPGKDIWVWTGYMWEDICKLEAVQDIDVIVDGPFVESLKDLRLEYRGSSNQRVIDVRESLKRGCAIRYSE